MSISSPTPTTATTCNIIRCIRWLQNLSTHFCKKVNAEFIQNVLLIVNALLLHLDQAVDLNSGICALQELLTCTRLVFSAFASSCFMALYKYSIIITGPPRRGASIVLLSGVCRRRLLLSSVVICNTARRACRRLHPRRQGDDVMSPPV